MFSESLNATDSQTGHQFFYDEVAAFGTCKKDEAVSTSHKDIIQQEKRNIKLQPGSRHLSVQLSFSV